MTKKEEKAIELGISVEKIEEWEKKLEKTTGAVTRTVKVAYYTGDAGDLNTRSRIADGPERALTFL